MPGVAGLFAPAGPVAVVDAVAAGPGAAVLVALAGLVVGPGVADLFAPAAVVGAAAVGSGAAVLVELAELVVEPGVVGRVGLAVALAFVDPAVVAAPGHVVAVEPVVVLTDLAAVAVFAVRATRVADLL